MVNESQICEPSGGFVRDGENNRKSLQTNKKLG